MAYALIFAVAYCVAFAALVLWNKAKNDRAAALLPSEQALGGIAGALASTVYWAVARQG